MTARNRVFTNLQRDLLTSVLNRLIPAEGQLPGAGDLGGRLIAQGTPEQVAKVKKSFTGQYLQPILKNGRVAVGEAVGAAVGD